MCSSLLCYWVLLVIVSFIIVFILFWLCLVGILLSYCLFQLFHPLLCYWLLLVIIIQSTKFTHMCPVLLSQYSIHYCVIVLLVIVSIIIHLILVVFGWHLICIIVLLSVVLCFNHSTHMYPIISYKFHLTCSYSTQSSPTCIHHFCLIVCCFISICSYFIRVSPPPCDQFNYFISYSPNFTMRFRRCQYCKASLWILYLSKGSAKLLFDCNANF